MSEQNETGDTSPEQKVAWIFENTGHEVSRAVGLEPGTVDCFATLRAGLVHSRTYWKIWETCPAGLDATLAQLEQERQTRQADRALGVIMQGGLPAGYQTDFEGRATNAVTLRRLALELSGIAEDARNATHRYEEKELHQLYVPRRGRTRDGEIVDLVDYIESWSRARERRSLVIVGPTGAGKRTSVLNAMHRIGRAFRDDIEGTAPLIWWQPYQRPVWREALLQGWAIAVQIQDERKEPPEFRGIIISSSPGLLPAEAQESILVELLPLEPIQVERWFRKELAPDVADLFSTAHGRVPAFHELAMIPANLSPLRAAIHSLEGRSAGHLPEWLARVLATYADQVMKSRALDIESSSLLERVALKQFALDRGFTRDEFFRHYEAEKKVRGLRDLGWVAPRSAQARHEYEKAEREEYFSNVLIRDYFVARQIASEVRAGRPEILSRYQFPKEYVLLFLAVIAPEVAAQATADRSAELRATVEQEVERRLQLTLAHMLKRSAGALRSHLKTLKRSISSQEACALQYELARIEQELTFQSALAEQTRLLHEVPEMVTEALSVREVIEPIIQQQKEANPPVQCDVQIPKGLQVQASRDGLREVLHCLLENAFQAAACSEGPEDPQVTVRAERLGETVRVDVLDTGPGIAMNDRERIFEPYVTTKKGGEGKPLGTGMGLAIARRYAQHMGGRVGLDPEQPRTCFYVQLVAWKE